MRRSPSTLISYDWYSGVWQLYNNIVTDIGIYKALATASLYLLGVENVNLLIELYYHQRATLQVAGHTE